MDNLSILFLRKDGTVILRFPDRNGRTGTKMPAESPWYQLVSRGGGNYRSAGYFDSGARLIAARPLRNYPLVINVDASEVAALASWRNHAIFVGIGTLLALICSIFLLQILSNRIRRLVDSEVAAVRTSRELERANAKVDASLTLEGCNEVHGFLFSPARPTADIAKMLGELAPRAAGVGLRSSKSY